MQIASFFFFSGRMTRFHDWLHNFQPDCSKKTPVLKNLLSMSCSHPHLQHPAPPANRHGSLWHYTQTHHRQHPLQQPCLQELFLMNLQQPQILPRPLSRLSRDRPGFSLAPRYTRTHLLLSPCSVTRCCSLFLYVHPSHRAPPSHRPRTLCSV